MEILSMKSFAKQLNDMTFTDYYYRMKLLAKSVYKWDNLPNGMNEKWFENFLYRRGNFAFYPDSKRGFIVAECTMDGHLNNYEEPVSITPTGIDIEPVSLKVGKDCVLVRNNDEMRPTQPTIQLFAYRLADISRTIDVNVGAQKTPVMVFTTEKGKLTLKNIYAKYEGNEPVIFADKTVDPDSLRVLKTDAPIVFPELQRYKLDIWNECLTFLGINNANTEKRERLISDEVEANNEHIELSAESFLKSRQQAVDEINKLFGLNITVRRRKESEIKCMPDIQKSLQI